MARPPPHGSPHGIKLAHDTQHFRNVSHHRSGDHFRGWHYLLAGHQRLAPGHRGGSMLQAWSVFGALVVRTASREPEALSHMHSWCIGTDFGSHPYRSRTVPTRRFARVQKQIGRDSCLGLRAPAGPGRAH